MPRLPAIPHTYVQYIRQIQGLTAVVDRDDRFAEAERKKARELIAELTIILAQVEARTH